MTDFSGTSILSNEFVVIGRLSTDNLGVLLGPSAQCGPCGHRWQKVAQKLKYERNEMGLRSFRHWTRLNELIILVWSNVKMAKLWPPKDWPKVAAQLILSQLVAVVATFFEIWPLNFIQSGPRWLYRR